MKKLNDKTNKKYKGEKIMRNRFKSWALWLAIAALVVFCVKQFVGMDIQEGMDNFLNVLLPVLVGFGVVNNPNNSTNI